MGRGRISALRVYALKLLSDILKTILDVIFILALVLAVTGFELSERPFYIPDKQNWEPPPMSEFWLVPKQNYHESEHMKQAEAFKIDWGKEFFE